MQNYDYPGTLSENYGNPSYLHCKSISFVTLIHAEALHSGAFKSM